MHLVYRAPMRSRRDDVDAGLAVDRAVATGVCGIGGRLAEPPVGLAQALLLTEKTYDERTARRLARFAAVPEGAFVWTRDADGLFMLGRLTGDWHYDASGDAAEVDLVHVRDCDWTGPVGPADVPAAVAHTFGRGGRNFQQIHDGTVGPATWRRWNERQTT